MKKRKDLEDNLKKNDGKKSLNNCNLNWESATGMAKDREHWKNCCKKMPSLSKNLPGSV